MSTRRDLKGHLDLMLLSLIASGERHGYAIIRGLQARSDGRFALKEGTVYPALHRLEDAGLVASHVAVFDGRQRRLYELTAAGRESLIAGREEWASYSAGVAAVLGWST